MNDSNPDSSTVHSTSQPPANPPYPYASQSSQPPKESGSFLKFFARLGSALMIALGLVIVGVYAGVLSQAMSQGSGVSSWVYRDGDTEVHKIAIIPVEGVIEAEAANFVRKAVDAILDDEAVKAVVLRVNSPGGTISGSDQIWYQLHRLRLERSLPIVASYGGMAASGGYYISAMADHIFAERTTITGSIGVIAQAFTVHELMQKIGVKPEITHSTVATDKDFASPFREWTERDREQLVSILDDGQDRFIEVVAEGRQAVLDPDAVKELATGRVFTAPEALEAKLVDTIGYLDDAIKKARTLGGFPGAHDPKVIVYKSKAGLLDGLVGGVRSDSPLPSGSLSPQVARRWLTEMATPRMMYLYQP